MAAIGGWLYLLGAAGALLIAARLVRAGPTEGRNAALAALIATAIWLVVASGVLAHRIAQAPLEHAAEAIRNIGWLWVMAGIVGRRQQEWGVTPLGAIYVGIVSIEAVAVGLALSVLATGGATGALFPGLTIVQMLGASGGLLLVHNLLAAANQRERSALTGVFGAVALLWGYDLNIHSVAVLSRSEPLLLLALRPIIALAALAAIGLGLPRLAEPDARLSRPAVFRSVALFALAAWLILLGAATHASPRFGDVAQLTIVGAAIAAAGTLLALPRLRAHARVLILKHLFEHRYDYRAEWLRFTETLHRPGASQADAVPTRVIRALGDMVEARAGALFVRDASGLHLAGQLEGEPDWAPDANAASRLLHLTGPSEFIAHLADDAASPAGLSDLLAEAPALRHWWVAVPLMQSGEAEGLLLLGDPPFARPLDWEDIDLLKVAARHAASLLAEKRSSDALAETQRFEEFHRRFAFVLHDVKNLASQMAVLARNAERHGDNPEFRRDMVSTLRISADRLGTLTHRLAQKDESAALSRAAVDLDALVLRVAASARGRHPVRIAGRAGHVRGDAAALESILTHLLDNAIDASPHGAEVGVTLQEGDGSVVVEVRDAGRGMSEDFMRRELFRPFSSTKEGGFGIGAYQARRLAEALGGRLDVTSREGEGSCFKLTLASAAPSRGELAA